MASVEVNVAPALGAARVTVGAWLAESEPPLAPGAEAGAPGNAIDVQLAPAGEASTLPAGSAARTPAVCPPSVRPVYVFGDVHAAHALSSSWHWKVAPESGELNVTVALEPGERAGGAESIVVLGGCVSTVNDGVAGDASVFPAASLARTDTLWAPSASAVVVHGLVHAAQTAESTRHSNVEPASLEVNAKLGVLSLVVPVGPEVIVVSGAVVSGGGGADPTVIGFIVLSVSPSASATVTRTFLTPGSWKVNVIVLPVPSGHCPPAGPSVPSSTQV
jgi:hypothetical protein